MQEGIAFAKMHGLGNDFIIINKQEILPEYVLSQFVLQIAHRHTGIGCDQLIVYDKLFDQYEMSIYNRDGSSAKTCGNALRCLSKLIYMQSGIRSITVNVAGRQISCTSLTQDDIQVNMGSVSFYKKWMPAQDKIWAIAERYALTPKELICVDIGNPHIVIFGNFSSQDQEVIGNTLQTDGSFVEGINVNFASIQDNKIILSVWERGTGLTLACGSGACATFAAAIKCGFIKSEASVVFKLGILKMSQQGDDIIMTGSATLVATGRYYYHG